MKIYKIASMDISVSGASYEGIRHLHDLAWHLKRKVITKMWESYTEQEKAFFEKHNGRWNFEVDGQSDHHGTEGTINLYTIGIPRNRIGEAIYLTESELQKSKIKYSTTKKLEQSGMIASYVLRFVIEEIPDPKLPPELNMANENARRVFEGILGYSFEHDGFTVNANDLLSRINAIENQESHGRMNEFVHDGMQDGNMIEPAKTQDYYLSRMQQIKVIAQWAITNGFDSVSVF